MPRGVTNYADGNILSVSKFRTCGLDQKEMEHFTYKKGDIA